MRSCEEKEGPHTCGADCGEDNHHGGVEKESFQCPREPQRQGRRSVGRSWVGLGQEEALRGRGMHAKCPHWSRTTAK